MQTPGRRLPPGSFHKLDIPQALLVKLQHDCDDCCTTKKSCKFAHELQHDCNAGEEGIVMNELGRHLQFPTRTFHKPNYLQDFLQRLGLIYTKEQKGKTVVVCVRAPGPLLASYRQTNAPEGLWLQHGWLHAVHDAIEAGPPLSELDPSIDLAAPGAPLLLATHAEAASAVLSEAADAAVSQSARRSDLILASPAGSAAVPASTPTAPSHVMSSEQHEQTATRPGEAAEAPELNTGALVQHAAALMPAIPERSAALPEEQGVAEAVPSLTEVRLTYSLLVAAARGHTALCPVHGHHGVP